MPPYHFLIAEDDSAVRALLVRVIERTYPNATIDGVENGAAALAAFHEHPADLVLTDERMPSMSGLQLVRALRALPFGGPIVMVSMELTDGSLAYAVGVTRFLQKPLSINELQAVLASLLPVQHV